MNSTTLQLLVGPLALAIATPAPSRREGERPSGRPSLCCSSMAAWGRSRCLAPTLEAACPRTDFAWLEVSAGSDHVFLLEKNRVPA